MIDRTAYAMVAFGAIQKVLPPQQKRAFAQFTYERLYTLLPPGRRKARVLSLLAERELSSISLESFSENTIRSVLSAAIAIYGKSWNAFSDALSRDTVKCFERAIQSLSAQPIHYLEIGSAQGLSMSFIGTTLKQLDLLGSLVSIDPYLEDGYTEAGTYVSIRKQSRSAALALYNSLGFEVQLLEKKSVDGLVDLIKADRKFDLIYIDGYHSGLTPAVDFGLSYQLLHEDGVMLIDDHAWPDVAPIKQLCDRHCERLWECWKTAAYKVKR